ncbi:MAG: hypothetical protein M0Z75_08600 [Nitrospiraceae bacterium]|nr:hypothetical protein [Nitrospiraceae bacterium]
MKKWFLAGLLLFLTACGGGGGNSNNAPASALVNATGTWSGQYTSTVYGAQTVTLNLMQQGNSITGTYAASTGADGQITGTVSGDTTYVNLSVTAGNCSETGAGTGIIDDQVTPNTMSFSYKGSSNCGGTESGTGNLIRQPTGGGSSASNNVR